YQIGPAALRTFALTAGALAYSDDGGCGWQGTGGLAPGELVTSLFVDPTTPGRVLVATSVVRDDGGVGERVLESGDGAATFGAVRYSGDGGFITGLESGRSDPPILYISLQTVAPAGPTLGRSLDGGVTWTFLDLGPAIGPGQAVLVAAAPGPARNNGRVFVRHVSPATASRPGSLPEEALVIVSDGGPTITRPVTFANGKLTGFLRMEDGTLLVAGLIGQTPALYRSDVAGATFAPVAAPPHIRGMAERAGVLYAATSNW